MDGLLVLLGLGGILAFFLGPIAFFATLGHGSRLRRLEMAVREMGERMAAVDARLANFVSAPDAGAAARPTDVTAPRLAVETPAAVAPIAPGAPIAGAAPVAEPAAPTAAEAAPAPAGAGADSRLSEAAGEPSPEAVGEPPPPPEGVAEPSSVATPPPPPPPKTSLEEQLGAKWAVWVGGVAVGLGALLLVRYSIEQGYFGPGARVTLGLVLAVALILLGENLRRREGGAPAPFGSEAARANAPAVLTGAGVVAAFGSVYAAHALYGFIGPAFAFVALGAVGLAAMLAASLHGPGLAALGLVGSLAAPLLVSSAHPTYWPVVLYLVVVASATYSLARVRRWLWLALSAASGGAAWTALMYAAGVEGAALDTFHAALAALVTQSALAALFLAIAPHRGGSDEAAGLDIPASAVLAVFAALGVLVFHHEIGFDNLDAWWIVAASALTAVLAVTGYLVAPVAAATALAGLTALAVLCLWPAESAARALDLAALIAHWRWPPPSELRNFVGFGVVAALGVAALSGWRLLNGATLTAIPAAIYAGAAGLTPLLAILIADARVADGAPSFTLAIGATVLAGFYVIAAAPFQRALATSESPATRLGLGAMAAAAIGALASGLVFALDGGALTVSLALAALGSAYVSTRLEIPALRWCVAGLGVGVAARLAWEPRVVGAALSPTPIFNWLLFGYGVPAVSFAFAARLMRAKSEDTPVRVADALSVLFAAFLVFFEIRHFINGGDPFARGSGLVEQGLVAVSAFGFALVLTRLDAARANVVFRWASLGAGALGMAISAISLLVAFDPYLDERPVEGGLIFNGLMLGYLLPALLAGALALAARRVRPLWYWAGAGGLAAALGLGYLALQLRVFFHGADIGYSEGFTLGELGLDVASCLVLAHLFEFVGGAIGRRVVFALFAAASAIGLTGLAGYYNPLFTDAAIAGGAVFNALPVAYLLPAALSVALARRVGAAMMRVAAILWLFAYVSLETRRAFQDAAIGLDRRAGNAEFYAYSAVWLALGLVLLVYGVWRGSREVRYASAFFVIATTVKVFLLDFAGLEGILRALSFIGLGLALIGLGLVYQKLVFAHAKPAPGGG